ncbi:hypothetical protein BLNAU_7471 [Blattamonas nauphoetae]|uniref:Right handed beta helix domain-containing protein n=1 Tax=Blattamonas nauphoetae TaxID=2049346 RepID=A0ABQ9Y1G2_9EUKA|nr:hypothetical protein BLNAU_7471 [Blattamonas nauphoetae]
MSTIFIHVLFTLFIHPLLSHIPPASLPLSHILTDKTPFFSSNSEGPSLIRLPSGQFHACEHMIQSTILNVEGSWSTLVHSSEIEPPRNSGNKSEMKAKHTTDERSSILVVVNSTVSLLSLNLDVRNGDAIVCRIRSSTLAMSRCTILSGSMCSPLAVGTKSGDSRTSILLSSCSHKSSLQNAVFPLVALESAPTPHFRDFMSNFEDGAAQGAVSGVCVTCSSFSLIDASVALGTGPLFDFGRICEHPNGGNTKLIETSLVHSRLLNASSSPSPDLSRLDPTDQRQSLIGVEVRGCENHLYGTACKDMNTGGSMSCLNSSFSRCSTALEPSSTLPAIALQHRTGAEQKLSFNALTDATTILIARCTFHSMASTSHGGSLCFNSVSASVSISECSFVDCHADVFLSDGGAVFCSTSADSASISLMSSFFSNCSAHRNGGTVQIDPKSTCTVSTNVFLAAEQKSSYGGSLGFLAPGSDLRISHNLFQNGTSYKGGCLLINLADSQTPAHIAFCVFKFGRGPGSGCYINKGTNPVTITHCEFVKGSGSHGGGIYLNTCSGQVNVMDSLFDECNALGGGIFAEKTLSFLFQRLKFRECTGVTGKDVYLCDVTRDRVVALNMITECVSTSGTNNLYFLANIKFDNDLIPPTSSIVVPANSIELLMFVDKNDVGGNLTVDMNKKVEGKMLVVLESDDYYEKPNEDSPPATSRLFVFDFPTPSYESTLPFCFNEWNLLQYDSHYSVFASLAGVSLTDYSTIVTTPNPPRIVEVLTELSESDPKNMAFQLKGRNLKSGNFTVKLKNLPDLSIRVKFTGQQTSSESRNMYSSTVGVLLFGSGSKLTFDTEYEIESVVKDSDSSLLILDPPRLFFTTPNPPRLTALGEPIISHNLDQSTLTISLSGCEIPPEQYSMNVSLVGGGSSVNITLNASFSSEESGTATAIVFDADNGDVDLLFGSEYSIESLWNENGSIWIPSSLTIVVPSSPGIVESVDSVSLNDAKTIVTLTLCGTDFHSGPTRVVLLEGSNEVGDSTVGKAKLQR